MKIHRVFQNKFTMLITIIDFSLLQNRMLPPYVVSLNPHDGLQATYSWPHFKLEENEAERSHDKSKFLQFISSSSRDVSTWKPPLCRITWVLSACLLYSKVTQLYIYMYIYIHIYILFSHIIFPRVLQK